GRVGPCCAGCADASADTSCCSVVTPGILLPVDRSFLPISACCHAAQSTSSLSRSALARYTRPEIPLLLGSVLPRRGVHRIRRHPIRSLLNLRWPLQLRKYIVVEGAPPTALPPEISGGRGSVLKPWKPPSSTT